MRILLYRNNRNPNKYIAVKHYRKSGQYYFCPFMYSPDTAVINFIGQRNRRYTRFRITSVWTQEVLYTDYQLTPFDDKTWVAVS